MNLKKNTREIGTASWKIDLRCRSWICGRSILDLQPQSHAQWWRAVCTPAVEPPDWLHFFGGEGVVVFQKINNTCSTCFTIETGWWSKLTGDVCFIYLMCVSLHIVMAGAFSREGDPAVGWQPLLHAHSYMVNPITMSSDSLERSRWMRGMCPG